MFPLFYYSCDEHCSHLCYNMFVNTVYTGGGNMAEAIRVENLVKKYGDFTAVKGISFDVEKGELFAFLGPNGAGKSTTINILVTVLKPTSGKVLVAGHDVQREKLKVRQKIGVVFQDPSLDSRLTVEDNLKIHGYVYGIYGAQLRKKMEEVLDIVELRDVKKRLVKHLSGGMRRRLEIARGLMHRPEVLFLDEPTTGLDPQNRAKIWEYVERIREEGTTVFFSTHYMDEAEYADRVAIMDHGEILALDTPKALRESIGGTVIVIRVDENQRDNAVSKLQAAGFKAHIAENGEIWVSVESATHSVPKIFGVLHNAIKEVDIRIPTLNDVFLTLTGRELRDSDASPEKFMPVRYRR